MRLIDLNDWDEEVERLFNINREYKIKKILCIFLRSASYITCIICFAFLLETFYDLTEKENLFWISAIAFLVGQYAKQYQSTLKKYEIKNLVFCIIDEETIIDVNYIKEENRVCIIFYDVIHETIDDFFVDCEVRVDDEIDDETLTIYPNRAELVLPKTE